MNLDIIHERLKKEHGLPSDFVFWKWEALPKTGSRLEDFVCTQITGGQCPILKSGKRKGRPNYRKATSKREFIVTNEQAAKWESEYESETGNCRGCTGSGRVVCRWDFENGTVDYRECSKCKGTGKSKAVEMAVA